ncbi:Holliday junction resolvase RuvX [Orrella sp. JC864]|uniref:Holliday junction resolvase RuvX n=1 Tax=Orrella sp. JC864 TaxID=3120298 RepID=UPI0012BC296F
MGQATLLAFDYGTRKLGVALGNTVTRQARALEIILAPTRQGRFARIGQLLQAWQPARLVVGLPLAPDGGEQHASLKGRRFANQLAGRYGLPVVLVDERGSSLQAQDKLGTHADDDAVAAAIILQRYLDALPAPAH